MVCLRDDAGSPFAGSRHRQDASQLGSGVFLQGAQMRVIYADNHVDNHR